MVVVERGLLVDENGEDGKWTENDEGRIMEYEMTEGSPWLAAKMLKTCARAMKLPLAKKGLYGSFAAPHPRTHTA